VFFEGERPMGILRVPEVGRRQNLLVCVVLCALGMLGCGATEDPGSVGASHPNEGASHPNVLLVSIDTLRGDFLEEAPFLAERAAQGRSFSRAYASSNWTLPSHLSLLTSLPYSEHCLPPPRADPPYTGLELPLGQPTLAEVLRAAGYATAATTEGGWLLPRFGLERGFERFVTTKPLSAGGTSDFEDHLAFVHRFVGEQGSRPFFLFAHTYRVHDYFINTPAYHDLLLPEDAPYAAWGNLREAVKEGRGWPPKEFVRRLYTAGVHRTDRFLAELVAAVLDVSKDAPLLVVVTSDHGESLGEQAGVWGHGHSLDDVQIRVPLVAWSAGQRSPERGLAGKVEVAVSNLDIAPSILRWLGIGVPNAFRGAGDRLLADPESVPVVARHHAETKEPRRGGIHQIVLLENLRYLRADRYDGKSWGESCQGLGGDSVSLKHCSPHRRELLRQWGTKPGGAMQLIARDSLSLLVAGGAEKVAAVQPALPADDALLDASGRVEWSPEGPGEFLLVYPRVGDFRWARIEVAGQLVAEDVTLEDLAAKSKFPYIARGQRESLLVLTEGLAATRKGTELKVDPEVLEELRALGYLGG
jgi:arylsulfatase A-like enzyme